jgi:hypothetical protein
MGESQKEIRKRQQTPNNFALGSCPKNIMYQIARNVKIAYKFGASIVVVMLNYLYLAAKVFGN